MSEKQSKHQLAAILFADIVGYTAMMQQEERTALEKLNRFKEVIENQTAQYKGKIIQYYGDGCLVIFNSSVDAVDCAKVLQEDLRKSPSVPVRIGIHSGDVLFKENNVFGDAVNVTSRIESMGIPGAILLSNTVKSQIQNKPAFQLAPLGTFRFKNIVEPIEVFALSNAGFPIPSQREIRRKVKAAGTGQQIGQLSGMYRWMWALLILVALGGIWFWKTQSAQGTKDNDPYTRYLIMPFSVQGSADIQYLGKGMVDLLSTKMDGIGKIRTIDPNIVLSKVSTRSEEIRNPQFALKAFADFQPKRLIMGNLVQLGPQFRFSASLYDGQGTLISKSEALAQNEENLPLVIDGLIRKLISNELAIAGKESESLAARATNNLDVLKKYLEGENYRRNSQFKNANKAFEAAVQIDSTFALGWYKLYRLYDWAPGALPRKTVYTKTKLLRSKLPEKFQLLFDAYLAFSTLDDKKLKHLYRRGVRQYGEDVELLRIYGEYLFHSGNKYLGHFTDAKPYFQKVSQYTPDDREVNVHLAHIAHYEGDIVALDSITAQTSPNSAYWATQRVMQLLLKDAVNDKPALDKIVNAKGFYTFQALINSSTGYNMPQIDTLLKNILSVKRSISPAEQLSTYMVKSARGQTLPELPEKHKKEMAYFMHTDIGEPNAIPNKQYFEPFRQRLLQSEGKPRHKLKSLWRLNIYNAFLGDQQAYEQTEKEIKTHFNSEDEGAFARLLHQYCEVIRYRNLGENQQALEHIDSLFNQTISPGVKFLYNENFGIIHLIKAEILYERGQFEAAYKWFKTVPDFTHTKFQPLGFVSMRMGQCQEQLNQNNKALQHYNYFLELYQDCEEQYQPWVKTVRSARDRIFPN